MDRRRGQRQASLMSSTGTSGVFKHLSFFTAGFVFDAVMIRRIDDEKVLIQQGLYLILCGILLAYLAVRREGAHRWSAPALHFMLGTLLNAYALFYVKSASGLSAVLFLVFISILLLVNELLEFELQQLQARSARDEKAELRMSSLLGMSSLH